MKKRILAYTAMMLLCSVPAFAQILPGAKDTALPIEISADNLKVLQKDQVAEFQGKVEAIQGEIRLNSDKMTVFYRGGGDNKKSAGQPAVSKIIVDGNVFLANPRETAKGQNGVYDVDNKTVTLTGNVVLTRDKNVLNGNKLIYNMDSGKSELFGGSGVVQPDGTTSSGGRVKGLFVPGTQKN